MTRFQVLQAITDVHNFAALVWNLTQHKHSEKEFEELLKSELSEDGQRYMLTAAQNGGYPLSMERLQ